MKAIEAKIRDTLQSKGIKCQSVFLMSDIDETRVLLSFNSQKNPRLTTRKIDRVLNEMSENRFGVPKEFQRLSSAFLHLEIRLGARTETKVLPSAQ